MAHLINTIKHAVYVYGTAFFGALIAAGVNVDSLSTATSAEAALLPAGIAAAVKVAPKLPAILAWLSAEANAAPTSGLAPEAE